MKVCSVFTDMANGDLDVVGIIWHDHQVRLGLFLLDFELAFGPSLKIDTKCSIIQIASRYYLQHISPFWKAWAARWKASWAASPC